MVQRVTEAIKDQSDCLAQWGRRAIKETKEIALSALPFLLQRALPYASKDPQERSVNKVQSDPLDYQEFLDHRVCQDHWEIKESQAVQD